MPFSPRHRSLKLWSALALISLVPLMSASCGDDESATPGPTTTATTSTGGMGGSGSGSGGSASSSSGGQTCQACLVPLYESDGDCDAAQQACGADTDCTAWENCAFAGCLANGDFTAACYEACNAMYPGSATLINAVRDCGCATCNASVCGGFCEAGGGGAGTGGTGGSGGAGGTGGN